jgi:hypothetical protein
MFPLRCLAAGMVLQVINLVQKMLKKMTIYVIVLTQDEDRRIILALSGVSLE